MKSPESGINFEQENVEVIKEEDPRNTPDWGRLSNIFGEAQAGYWKDKFDRTRAILDRVLEADKADNVIAMPDFKKALSAFTEKREKFRMILQVDDPDGYGQSVIERLGNESEIAGANVDRMLDQHARGEHMFPDGR